MFLSIFTAVHLAAGVALAAAENHYVEQYREFAQRLAPMVESKRLWSNAEWGLRYYLGELGSEPLLHDQTLRTGDVVVTSELAATIPFRATDPKLELLQADIAVGPLPLQTIGLESRSGYSSSEFGILPFDWGYGSIDRVAATKLATPSRRPATYGWTLPKRKPISSAASIGLKPPTGAGWANRDRPLFLYLKIPASSNWFFTFPKPRPHDVQP